MIHISPIAHAWVPVDARAADRVAAPNYDEFQSDLDVIHFLESKPDCILKVTMPHCDLPEPEARMLVEGSEEALSRAGQNFKALTASPWVRAVEDVLAVYAITDPTRPSQRQMGLCGLADTRQIRMDDQPDGAIIRNEGIYQHKMLGRAALTRAIGAFVASVNLAVDDADGRLIARLEATADARRATTRRRTTRATATRSGSWRTPRTCRRSSSCWPPSPTPTSPTATTGAPPRTTWAARVFWR